MPARQASKLDRVPKKDRVQGKAKKPRAQREFRDRLFKFIFGEPEQKNTPQKENKDQQNPLIDC